MAIMKQVATLPEKELWFEQLNRPFRFKSPFDGMDFALLIIANDPTVTAEERSVISREVIDQGCRYAVCAGDKCSIWHDDIDIAFISTDPDFNPPDDRFVTTTWHDDESLEEVFEFFHLWTCFDDFWPKRFLVLFVGGDDRVRAELMKAISDRYPAVAPE